jgi:imidazole glycerol-phosphate synthase subunit HisH
VSTLIAIIDYGVGNLKSVEKAFQFIGSDAVVSADPDFILKADGIVLPGVGAFADAMDSLRRAGMAEVVKKVIAEDRPFLGICLGMQLLFDYSEEGGERVEGLGIFKGSIKQLPFDMNLKVPHMGWNCIKINREQKLFKDLGSSPYVYFVHSYYLNAEDHELVAATTTYGMEFDVAVSKGNVAATQFHPEKSGEVGLKILRNFVKLIGK